MKINLSLLLIKVLVRKRLLEYGKNIYNNMNKVSYQISISNLYNTIILY